MATHILLHHLPVKCKEIGYDSAMCYTAESFLQLTGHIGIQTSVSGFYARWWKTIFKGLGHHFLIVLVFNTLINETQFNSIFIFTF